MTMMFFLLPSSRQTRRTISPSDSVKGDRLAFLQDVLGELAGLDLLAPHEGVEVGDEDLGLPNSSIRSGGTISQGGSSCSGSLGSSTRSRSRMVMPGVTIRKVSVNRASCGFASLFSDCQAMSMAMTTVLPEPVAILQAMRNRPGLCVFVELAERFSIQASPYFLAASVR